MKKLENKVTVITGGGWGMGKAIALLFASEGSKVILADINEGRLDEVAQEIKALGAEVNTLVADISKQEDIDAMIDLAVSNFGTLDILVNNVGIMEHFEAVGEVSNNMWDKIMSMNVDGPFKAMRKAVNIFLPKKSGQIINITSLGGINGTRAGAAYTTSKHALVGLTKITEYMYSKMGIRCTAIVPSDITTNIGDSIDNFKMSDLVNGHIMPGMALNPRSGEPSEIAKVALFLVSEDARFINGEVVDGDWNAY